jgi:hypothetical protein
MQQQGWLDNELSNVLSSKHNALGSDKDVVYYEQKND